MARSTAALDIHNTYLPVMYGNDSECEPSPDLNQSDWSQRLKEYKATRGIKGFTCGSYGKESAWNAGDSGSIPGLGRSPGERNGNPLQYSCLGNPMDRGAWHATVYEVTKGRTQLSDYHTQRNQLFRHHRMPRLENILF